MNALNNLFKSKSANGATAPKVRRKGGFIELAEDPAVPTVSEAPATESLATTENVAAATPMVSEEAPVTAEAAPVPVATKPAKTVKAKAEPAAPKAKPAAPAAPAAPTITNYATDYLMQSQTPRRRPGPSLNSFMDMAMQVKTGKSEE